MSLNYKECIEIRRVPTRALSVRRLARGYVGAIIARFHTPTDTGHAMTEQTSTLYAKLLGQTAAITWQELQPFFARGALLWVDGRQDLVRVAEAVASNDQAKVKLWMEQGVLGKLEDDQAEDLLARDPQLWAVVVAPWVLVQERASSAALH